MKSKPIQLFRLASAIAMAGLLNLPVCGQALANRPRFEEDTTDVGRALVEQATRGDLAQAFQLANDLRRPNDTALANSLEQQRQLLASQRGALGAAGTVRMTDELHFGGCVTHEFHVRYAAGEMRWIVKFRHGVGGFYLYDLVVVSPVS